MGTSVPTPVTWGGGGGTNTNMATGAVGGTPNATLTPPVMPNGGGGAATSTMAGTVGGLLNELQTMSKQDPIGPDPSVGKKKELFGITMTTDAILRKKLAPDGLSDKIQEQLCEQMLDSTSLPGTCMVNNDETQLTSLARAMSQLVDNARAPLGGQNDTQFKSTKRNTLGNIKSQEILHERIVELHECEEMVMENTMTNLVAVLRCAGLEELVAIYLSRNCLLLRISSDTFKNFCSLHSHIKYVADNRGWLSAQLVMNYYAKKLLEIRNLYSSRVTVLCYHYIFLTDSTDKGWQSLRLQDTQIGQILTKLEDSSSNPGAKGKGGGDTADTNKFNGCRYCGSSIHSGGKPNCPWSGLSHKAAKAAARDALRKMNSPEGGESQEGKEDPP